MVHKRQVAVVVDSSSCIPRALLEQWGIITVAHQLTIGDRSFKDGVDIEPYQFYQMIEQNTSTPTTSSPNPSSFLEAFRSASEGADAVVCITLSENFSATYHAACTAASMALDEHITCPVVVVDSRAAAGAEGLIALSAARAAWNGADLEQVTSKMKELIPKVNLLAFLDTLDYLKKSGRVPRVAAWAGSILGIRPLTELTLGEARVVEKPRSLRAALDRLLAVTKGRVGRSPVHVNVMHACASADAEDLRQRIERELCCEELFVSEFTPVMGAHLGPGLVGLAFYVDGEPKDPGAATYPAV